MVFMKTPTRAIEEFSKVNLHSPKVRNDPNVLHGYLCSQSHNAKQQNDGIHAAQPNPSIFPTSLNTLSSMDTLLHLRVNRDHLRIQIRMIPHQDLGIPGRSHKERIDATANRRHEDLADLKSDQERKRHDRYGVGS